MDDEELADKIVLRLLRKRVVGRRTVSVETVAGWFPTHLGGRVKELVEQLSRDPDSPIESTRKRGVRLVGLSEASQFLGTNRDPFRWDVTERAPEQSGEQYLREGIDQLNEQISELLGEIDTANSETEVWRKKARRRQRINLFVAVLSAVLGVVIGLFL